MNTNATDFLAAWKSIEESLRTEEGQYGRHSKDANDLLFGLAERNPIVRTNLRDLQQFINMGAVLAGEASREPVVEITTAAVNRAKAIADILKAPPLVVPEFERKVLTIRPNEPLLGVLARMKECDYSQVPVVGADGTIKALLTTDTISRWLADCVSDETRFKRLRETRLEEVLACAEKQQAGSETFEIVSAKMNCFEALKLFEQAVTSGRRLDALIITINGLKRGEIKGIITGWDMPTIVQRTSISRLLAEAARQRNDANQFIREGATYRIRFDKKEWTVKASAGAHYLCELLHHPRQEFRSTELINRLTGNYQATTTVEEPLAEDSSEEFTASVHGSRSSKDFSVEKTVQNYRTRLKKIAEMRSELKRKGDAVDQKHLAELDEECASLGEQIDKMTGLNGRIHAPIKSVVNRGDTIRRAIGRCMDECADRKNQITIKALKDHISDHINFGVICNYTPPPNIKWQ